jgi:hypothetical protein
MRDDDLLTPEFYEVCGGYLGMSPKQLEEIEPLLPKPKSPRERGIAACIRFGIENPEAWVEAQKPFQLKNRPEVW